MFAGSKFAQGQQMGSEVSLDLFQSIIYQAYGHLSKATGTFFVGFVCLQGRNDHASLSECCGVYLKTEF